MVLGPGIEADTVVPALAVDSRLIREGALFVALKGVERHGAAFLPQAIAAGAAAVLTDLEGALMGREMLGEWPVPFLIDPEPRARLAQIAAAFSPEQPESLTAVTGTNGKTSVADFTRQIWGAMGLAAASFGTTGIKGPGIDEPLSHTTPEPITLHALLSRLSGAGATHAAMEASSHGLAQYRLDGARLRAAAFTNLSRDHLDYHATAEEYAAAKLRLFAEVLPGDGTVVANADDALYPALSELAFARGLRLIPFGRGADDTGLRLVAQDTHLAGQHIRIGFGGETHLVELDLIGGFQALNALAAAGLAIGAGAPSAHVFAALPKLKGVRGRMELVARRANGAGVFVDYAHTPDAVATALAALRPHTPGRVVVVLGAGGDRDPGKRVLMGQAAAAGADAVIVTDDNPRTEDPALIRQAVMEGCPEAEETGDRAEAILRGVDALLPGDALLVAGKGHEPGQTIGTTVHPFDDAEQARASVTALDGEEGVLVRLD
ncbi:MAG: UDP-N-acetylmuramoyl-L-alanyl-D-glutamate--2,6-diaminopimelate ligase [Pseudomonadota bacterium]